MTTPTTAEVGHGSKEPTVVEIDGFRGWLISADHADYDNARAVWNGAIDRRPHLIARCIGTADVVAAVRFARDHDLEIAIRGGGHNVAGTAVCDDGIVIDLSAMRAVRVDPADRRAWVQGGALWGDVDHETQAHGLATTGGNREPHRSSRAHPRWWRRLADAQARPHGRQPPRRRGRDGRWRAVAGVRGRAPRPVLGVARRRRQLRRGHLVRVPPPLRRARRPGRAHPLGRDRRRGGPPLLPRLRPRRSRRARHGREVRRRAAATGHPRGSALAPGGDGRYLLRRADRGR